MLKVRDTKVHLGQAQNNKSHRFVNKEKSRILDSNPSQLLASDYKSNVTYTFESKWPGFAIKKIDMEWDSNPEREKP